MYQSAAKEPTNLLHLQGFVFWINARNSLEIDLLEADLDRADFVDVLKQVKDAYPSWQAGCSLGSLLDNLLDVEDSWQGKKPPQDVIDFVRYWSRDSNLAVIEQRISVFKQQDLMPLPEEWAEIPTRLARLNRRLDVFFERAAFENLAREFPQRHDGYVYLFKLPNTQYYKIGYSNDPERRSREVVSGLPIEVKIVHTIRTNQAPCLERVLHIAYAHCRYDNKKEWFKLTKEEVDRICESQEENFEWIDNPEEWEDVLRAEPKSPINPYAQQAPRSMPVGRPPGRPLPPGAPPVTPPWGRSSPQRPSPPALKREEE